MNVLAWLTAAGAGWFWVRALWPRPEGGRLWARLTAELALSFIFGVGACATAFFALLWSGLKPGAAAWSGDAAVLAGGVVLWLIRRGRKGGGEPEEAIRPLPLAWMAGLAAALSFVAFLAAAGVYLRANPQGDWDAWAIWNLRAKFLASEGFWRNAVSPELTETHPEYPLLWPAAVARAWAESGSVSQAAPQTGAWLAAASLVLLFAGGLGMTGGWPWAAAGTATLLMTVPLWRSAGSQYADVPLAMFFLGSVIAGELARRAGWSGPIAALSGALAAFGAFTKNEGLVFCLLMAGAVLFMARQRAAWWLAGAVPALALTLLFQWLLAPSKSLLSMASFQQAGRLATVLEGMAGAVWKSGGFPAHPLLFAAILLAVFRPEKPWKPAWPAAVAGLMLCADIAVMWGSPNDAAWQVGTAADRLLMHVMPVLILCAFWWLAKAPEQAAAVEPPAKPEPRRKPRKASGAKE